MGRKKRGIEPLNKFGRLIMPQQIGDFKISVLDYNHYMDLIGEQGSSSNLHCGKLKNSYGDCKSPHRYLATNKQGEPIAIGGFCSEGGICFAKFGGERKPHEVFSDSDVFRFDGTFLVYHPNATYSKEVEKSPRARQIFNLLEKGHNPIENPEMFRVNGWNLNHHTIGGFSKNTCLTQERFVETNRINDDSGLEAEVQYYGGIKHEHIEFTHPRYGKLHARLYYREGNEPDEIIGERIVIEEEVPVRLKKNIARTLLGDPLDIGYNASVDVVFQEKPKRKHVKTQKEKIPKRFRKMLKRIERRLQSIA